MARFCINNSETNEATTGLSVDCKCWCTCSPCCVTSSWNLLTKYSEGEVLSIGSAPFSCARLLVSSRTILATCKTYLLLGARGIALANEQLVFTANELN